MHELQVYTLELEMQNEEILSTQAQAYAALDRYAELFDFAPVGYLTLNNKGRIIEINLTGAAILGVERAVIFEPFFPTKLNGSGLGLVISRSLIEANGGQLWMELNVTRGAIFHFTLQQQVFIERGILIPIIF